ncbi:hypothetical protein ACHAWF_009773 [Thalassiosira exigua]
MSEPNPLSLYALFLLFYLGLLSTIAAVDSVARWVSSFLAEREEAAERRRRSRGATRDEGILSALRLRLDADTAARRNVREGWVAYEWVDEAADCDSEWGAASSATGGYGSVDDDDGPSSPLHDTDRSLWPSCPICLCDYERGDAVIRLPCAHVYHDSCIGEWTRSHARCPLCNRDLRGREKDLAADGYRYPLSMP